MTLPRPLPAELPLAAYRLQMGASGFAQAAALAGYLARLGVSDVYASPLMAAVSPHGYDVTDPTRVNPALGSAEDFLAWSDRLRELGLGLIVDVVPNHMGIRQGNAWWDEVLENGPASPYARYFDIDFAPLKPELHGRVLLPLLGDQYGRVLERGELRLERERGAFFCRYHERALPLDPCSYVPLLEEAAARLEPGPQAAHVELQSILTALRNLPPRPTTDEAKRQERQREKEVVKGRLARLLEECPALEGALEAVLAEYNGTPGDPASFDRLDRLLQDQAYRLAYWRVAAEEINYRRFFDVNELAAIRVEEPEVFAATHAWLREQVRAGRVRGVRVDHPDGLYDPAGYFQALQGLAQREEGPGAGLYVVAEKIVAPEEALPADWAIHGTTGYEFLNAATGLLVDSANARALTDTYQRFTGEKPRYGETVYQAKRLILQSSLASELQVLAHRLARLSERHRHYRDFTLGSLTEALREVIAAFGVYRTYVRPDTLRPDEHDREAVELAVRAARRRNPTAEASVFEFLRRLLLLEIPELGEEARAFVLKFQQLTGPVTAKGLEDTAFYRYNRLVALNEVGGEPGRFGTSLEAFHRQNQSRVARFPHTMISTSTHDTKRSEDVRARLAVLSELPEEWRRAVFAWARHNKGKKTVVEGEAAPGRDDEYLFYQTLLGVWPLQPDPGLPERLVAYMTKAAKEAKVHTSWVAPSAAYDQALELFVRAVLDDPKFLARFEPLRRKVAVYGMLNSLTQTVLKYASPGVPDLYQGNEAWDFSLVDPDNRRPVDFARLEALLGGLEGRYPGVGLAGELLASWPDGRVKLWVTHQALQHRRANPGVYREGGYRPLGVDGPAAAHAVAFAREAGAARLVAVAPRLWVRLSAGADVPALGAQPWHGTRLELPEGRYHHLFTGEVFTVDGVIELSDLLAHFPVAMLHLEAAP